MKRRLFITICAGGTLLPWVARGDDDAPLTSPTEPALVEPTPLWHNGGPVDGARPAPLHLGYVPRRWSSES